jgi:preprotein translocase subunit SecG
MELAFRIALIVVSLLLIVLVLLHKGRGGGMSDMFGGGGGGGNQSGSSVAEKNLNRFTLGLGVIWLALIISLGLILKG